MKLYGYRNGRTLRAAWALAEAQASFEYVEVDLFSGGARTSEFLAINPFGKVPVLIDGEQVITESAAICLHIAEKFVGCGLLPAAGSPGRTQCYQWISFILTEMDAPLWTVAKHRFALPPERRVPAVIATAVWEFARAADVLANHVSGRACIAGRAFSIADILAAHVLLWGKSARVLEPHPGLERYLEALLARPAYEAAKMRLIPARGPHPGAEP